MIEITTNNSTNVKAARRPKREVRHCEVVRVLEKQTRIGWEYE